MSKIEYYTKEYDLNDESIDEISEEAVKLISQISNNKKAIQRIRLSVEESLIVWKEKIGEGSRVKVESGRKFLRSFFRVCAIGKQCNPYSDSSEDFGSAKQNMLANIGLIPEYSYNHGENELTFFIPRKQMNQIVKLMLIILAAAVVGIAGNLFIPANVIKTLSESLIAPIEETVFRVLSCIAGPMIFLSVAWGIYGIGDVYTLGRVGKKLMVNILLVVFIASSFSFIFYPFLGPSFSDSVLGNSQFGKLFEMILNIFPANIFSPFIEGNTLQIIFLAFLIGLSMIFLGQRTSSVARAVEQINHIISFLMNIISKLVPYFVFIVLVKLIWANNFSELTKVWKFALAFVLAQLVFMTVFTVYVSIKNRVRISYLIKSCIPSYLIALSTASSSATFETNMRICKTKFNISDAFSSFGVPFSMVLFKPSTAIYYTMLCFFFAKMYDVKVSIIWILIAIIITAVSAIATPPIPGGAAATYTVLFLQLGIPSSALAIAMAIDMIFDFILTSGDMYLLLMEVLNVSGKLGMREKQEKKQ